MQLTSIDQYKVGMSVWHPVYGEGTIKKINESYPDQALYHFCVLVSFYKPKKGLWNNFSTHTVVNWFYSDGIEWNTKHLFTEPVYICEKVEVTIGDAFEGQPMTETRYLPIKLETK